MARKTWIGTGGVDGDWGDAANWLGGLPVAGDTVMVDSQSVVSPTINQGALAAVAILSMDVSPGAVDLEMGTESVYLQMQSSRLRWEAPGSKGAIWFQTSSCDAQIVAGPTSPDSLLLSGELSLGLVGVLGGACRITAAPLGLTAVGQPYVGPFGQLVIDALGGPFAITQIRVAGQAESSHSLSAVVMTGAGPYLETNGNGFVGNVLMGSGARVQHNSSGNIVGIDASGGGSITTNPESTAQIGVGGGVVVLGGDARIQAGPAVTFPNGVQIVSRGSPLIVPASTEMQIISAVDP